MQSRGCSYYITSDTPNIHGYILFYCNEQERTVQGEDIENALHAAYRVEWEPLAIMKRFERYLIDLYNKRQKGIL